MAVSPEVHVPLPEVLEQQDPTVISQGAEALIFIVNKPNGERNIAKFRPAKPWRIEALDTQLRKRRTNQEARVLTKLTAAGVRCPKLLYVDANGGLIYMEFIEGISLKEATWQRGLEGASKYYTQLGRMIARMHSLRVVHGDLTTSNAMVLPGDEVCLIDFGLSSQDASVEDKAVDLYVLERAIQSTHPTPAADLMSTLLRGYEDEATTISDPQISDVMARLQYVRQRGRKRTMIG